MVTSFDRVLLAKMDDGSTHQFVVSISCPIEIEDSFYCTIQSDGILSESAIKMYGIDAIEALEYAIHMVDVLIFEKPQAFTVLWPDGSDYLRSKTLSYRWTMPPRSAT